MAFLPFGYIIAVFAQCLYSINCPVFSDTIYREIIRRHQDGQTLVNENNDFEHQIESLIEANLMVPGRLTGPNESDTKYVTKNIERLKWFSELITKRWDVYAISNSLILATILSFLCAFLTFSYLERLSTEWFNIPIAISIPVLSALFLIKLSWLLKNLILKYQHHNNTKWYKHLEIPLIITILIIGVLVIAFTVNKPIPGCVYLFILSMLLFSRILMKERLVIMYTDMFNAYPNLAGQYRRQ